MTTSTRMPIKERLKKIEMVEKKVWTLIEEKEDVFTWMIGHFQGFKKNVEYWNIATKTGWIFLITKCKGLYDIKIDTVGSPYSDVITSLVSYGDSTSAYSAPIKAAKARGFVHSVKVPVAMINSPQNSCLRYNTAVFEFRCNIRRRLISAVCGDSFPQPGPYDERMHFLNDILPLSTQRRWTDFLIRVRGMPYGAHKSILAARSKYFREYIRENCIAGETGEIVMNDMPSGVMHSLIAFMYTGRTEVPPLQPEFDQEMQVLGISTVRKRY